MAIADALRTTIGDFHFQWNQRSFKIGASVGVVNVAGGPQTLAGVLSAADAACYMAKDKGRNRVQVYSPESDEVTLRKGEMEWVNIASSAQLAWWEEAAALPISPRCTATCRRTAR